MSFDAIGLARPAVVAMTAYQSARSDSHGISGRVYLDANELGVGGQPDLNRYPDPQPPELIEFLCERFGVPAASLFLGAGVDDAIDALLRVFCEAGKDSIVVTPPTYGFYAVAAAIQGARVLTAPLTAGAFDLDDAAIVSTCEASTKLIFVCSPNNPTGNSYDPARLLALAAKLSPRLLIVDEAYIEFTHRASLVQDGAKPGNLVVLRTLSKAWGLAGARLGAAVGDPAVISLMHKVRAPYPISRPAAAAGMAELRRLTPQRLAQRTAAVAASRAALSTALSELPCVEHVYPSDANFLLVKTLDAAAFMRRCRQAGVVVRDRSSELGLGDCVRISIGSDEEHAALLAALQEDLTGGV